MTSGTFKIDRRALMTSIMAGGLTAGVSARSPENSGSTRFNEIELSRNPLLWTVAWSNTAAEFGALCHQAFNLARLRVDEAIEKHSRSERPLAVLTDVDNTIVHAGSYWSFLISEGIDFFDDEIWDRWIPENLIALVPGAMDFLTYCEYQGVEIFYVTNRDQGPRTYNYALKQLQYLNLPYSDPEHLVVFRESSDKTSARERISESHELLLLLGDNLNDFKRDYYVADVEERRALMERDRAEIGNKFIILPNATDGHWVRAIFGKSEPAATDENRLKLLAAGTRGAWIRGRSTQG